MYLALIIVAVLAVLVGIYLFAASQAGRERPFYHFRCHKCQQRIKYQERQVGKPCRCPSCHAELRYPPVPKGPR
jgi:hypothetical protein